MIPILLTPQAATGVGSLTASATLTATGRKATSGAAGALTEAPGFTVTGEKAAFGWDIAYLTDEYGALLVDDVTGDPIWADGSTPLGAVVTMAGDGVQTTAGQGLIVLNDLWTSNDVWLVDDVTGLPLVDDVTGEWLWMDGHTPQVKRTSGAGTLTQPATFTSAASRTASGVGNLHYAFNAMSAAARKGAFGTGAIIESASFTSSGVRVPTGSGAIVLAATFAATGRKAASGTGALSLTTTMAATGTSAAVVVPPVVAHRPAGAALVIGRAEIRVKRARGAGEIHLEAILNATGVAWENDDWLIDDVLLMAA